MTLVLMINNLWWLNGLTKDVALAASTGACTVEHGCSVHYMHGGWNMCSRAWLSCALCTVVGACAVEHGCPVRYAQWLVHAQ